MSHDTKLNLHQRLHAVMGEVDYIQKERKGGVQYTIISHDAVTAKVRPVLVKHGVVYYPVGMDRKQDGNRTEMTLTIRFANIDDPTDHIDVVSAGYGIDGQDKGPGKAISYAVKFALLKTLGLETGDDPDYDNKPHEPRTPPPPKPPAPGPKSVERATPLRDARGEIERGEASTVAQKSPANQQVDAKQWATGNGGGDFLRRARTDLAALYDRAHLTQWMNEFEWERQAIHEHASDARNDLLNTLIAEAQDRCRNPADLRAAG